MSKELSQQEWQSRYDAETLMNAETIKKDAARLKRAKVQAKKMMAEEAKKLNALKTVTKVKKKGNPVGKKRSSGTKT